MKHELNKPLPLGYNRGAVTIPIPEFTWSTVFYILGSIGSLLTICSFVWRRRNDMSLPSWILPFLLINRQASTSKEDHACSHGCEHECSHGRSHEHLHDDRHSERVRYPSLPGSNPSIY